MEKSYEVSCSEPGIGHVRFLLPGAGGVELASVLDEIGAPSDLVGVHIDYAGCGTHTVRFTWALDD